MQAGAQAAQVAVEAFSRHLPRFSAVKEVGNSTHHPCPKMAQKQREMWPIVIVTMENHHVVWENPRFLYGDFPVRELLL